jgi:hypothetical protein
MALPTTGTISMSQINGALNRQFNASIGLKKSQIGTYASINTNSTLRPNGIEPFAMSKWKGYDKDAGGSVVSYEVTLYNQCNGDVLGNFFMDTPSIADATIIAYDSDLTSIAPDGFYSDGVFIGYWISGELLRVTRCGRGLILIGFDCFTIDDIAFTDSGDLENATFLGSDEELRKPLINGEYSDGVVRRYWNGESRFEGETGFCE